MKKLYILKIGGSVITQKNREQLYVYKKLLHSIAKNIKKALNKDKNIQLILIHGAGSAGHQIANKYNLCYGAKKNKKKIHKSLILRNANQNLNTIVSKIFLEEKLNITTIHTPATIIQKNGSVSYFNLELLKESMSKNYIPLLYGDMVLDKTLNMSVCSGDVIASYLAKKLGASIVFFASDIDGIFTKDPHKYKNAKLITRISLLKIFSNKIQLSKSHNVDVTGGISGKIKSFKNFPKNLNLKKIVIFNGNNPQNYYKILTNKNIIATHVHIKKT